jgi:hypothetical protein
MKVGEKGGIDHFVSVHGDPHDSGVLSELTGDAFMRTLRDKCLPNLVIAQAAVPLLVDRKGGGTTPTFTLITGHMGETCEDAEQALLTIGNAANYGIAAALQREREEKSWPFAVVGASSRETESIAL